LDKLTPATKKKNKILEWQKAAIKDGFKFSKYGIDGKWGKECEAVASKAICKKRLIQRYKNLTKIVQKAVGVEVDGKFGKDTKNAVISYQKNKKLTADGCVGLETWKKILNV
jgi:peptidoglycan hydrolase-like protein with peptidoglycan-binding domain